MPSIYQMTMNLQSIDPLTNATLVNVNVAGLTNPNGLDCICSTSPSPGSFLATEFGSATGFFIQNLDPTGSIMVSWSQSQTDTVGTQVAILTPGAMLSFFYPRGDRNIWWCKTQAVGGAIVQARVIVYE